MIPGPSASCSAGKAWDAKETFSRTVDLFADPIALLDEAGEILFLNQAARALLCAQNCCQEEYGTCLLQPEWATTLLREEAIPMALRGGVWRGETAALRADGTELPVHQTVFFVGPSGASVVAVVMRDLSREKLEDLQRIERANGHDAAVRASGSVLFHWDPASGEIAYHGRLEPLIGVSSGEMAGGMGRLQQMIHPDDLLMFQADLQRATAARGSLDTQFRLQRPDGKLVMMQMRGGFFLGQTGDLRELAGLLTDVSELWHTREQLALAREKLESRLQSRLQEARDEADQARRSKSELLSRMSHELRTPLNAILGFTQLLDMEPTTPQQAESIEHISRAGNHLLTLINEVLDLARLESGRLPLQTEPVELSGFLITVLDQVRPLAKQAAIAVSLEPSPEETPTHVMADAQRLRQVVLNLLTNAVKYNRPHGSVVLACGAATGGRVRISVLDTGHGISAASLRSILDPAESETAEGDHSVGVGLALSRGLVRALRGEIGGESELGRGSTFWIDLPAAEPVPMVAKSVLTPKDTAVAALGTTRHKILYVEDEELNLQLVERVLASHPELELVSTMQGSHALQLAREHRPDLILLDLNLPDLSGEIILAQLKDDASLRDIPVIMITADVMGDRIERLLNGGALTYLTKPFRISEFLAIIRETLDRQHE